MGGRSVLSCVFMACLCILHCVYVVFMTMFILCLETCVFLCLWSCVFMHFTLCLCCVYEKCLYCIWRLVSFCVYGVFLYFTHCLYSVNGSMRSCFGQVLVCISVCLLGIKLEYMCFPFYYGDVPINTVIITVFVLRVVFMVVFMKLCLWCVYDKKRLTPCLCVRFLLRSSQISAKTIHPYVSNSALSLLQISIVY